MPFISFRCSLRRFRIGDLGFQLPVDATSPRCSGTEKFWSVQLSLLPLRIPLHTLRFIQSSSPNNTCSISLFIEGDNLLWYGFPTGIWCRNIPVRIPVISVPCSLCFHVCLSPVFERSVVISIISRRRRRSFPRSLSSSSFTRYPYFQYSS